MELSKGEVILLSKWYPIMLKRAEIIWKDLMNIDPEKYEYVSSVDYLDFSEPELVYVSGFDGHSTCGTWIPLKYFYDDNWLECAINEMNKRKEVEKLRVEEHMRMVKEIADRKEYEKYLELKEKYEGLSE